MPARSPTTKSTPFAEWTKTRTAGAHLILAGAAAEVITLSRDAGKARDQIAALLRDAPKDVRDAAVEAPADGLGDTAARFTLSTERVDSYDSTLAVDGWDLADYKRNPIVLYAHNAHGLPVGRDIGAHVRTGENGSGALVGVTRFVNADLDPFGAKVGAFVKAGVLRAVSVGFEPVEFEVAEDRDTGDGMFVPVDFKRQRLREYSVVPVPANADCLVDEARLRDAGLTTRDVVALVERMIDGTDHLFVSRSELVALRRTLGGRMLITLGKLGQFTLVPTKRAEPATTATDDGTANPEAYTEDEHPEDPEGDGERAPVILACPECGAQAPAESFVTVEPTSGEGEATPPAPGDEMPEEDDPTRQEGRSALDAHDGPGHDADLEAEAEALADAIEAEEMRTTGRLP